MLKRLRTIMVSTVTFILIIYIIISAYYYFAQEKYIFFPEVLPEEFKFFYTQPFEEINFKTEKDIVINSLLFTVKEPKGLILYFHGNAGSLMNWGDIAPDFTKNGFDILIFDYRSYGKSNGKLSQRSLYSDSLFIYEKMIQRYGEKSIILYGRSIGTGIAAYTASKNDPAMLILESPYFSMKDLLKKYYPWLPSFLLRYQFRTDLYIVKAKYPVYLIHGSDDEIIDFSQSIKLKKILKKDNNLFGIPGGKHNDLRYTKEYQYTLTKLLN
ncbi:MAG: alpha/beta fold hydrolase [Acidobacteriota bacterium]